MKPKLSTFWLNYPPRIRRIAYGSHQGAVQRAKRYGHTKWCSWPEYHEWFKQCHLALCAGCGIQSEQTDHIKPMFRGGLHVIENLQRLCGSCNARKCAWLPGEIHNWPWMKAGRKNLKQYRNRPNLTEASSQCS